LRTRLVDCAPTGVVAPALTLMECMFMLVSILGLLEANDVVLPFANLESTALPTFLLDAVTVDPAGRARLAGLSEPTALPSLGSGERNRVPNLDSFSDCRPAKEDGAWGLVRI
jgi:hypothetical protein